MPDDEPMAAVRGDEGAILLIVLFVTTVLAVLIGVVLTNVEVNLRNSTVADNIDDKTYAADGGVEYAIQRLRQDPNACSDPTLTPWVQNDTTVAVSCTLAGGAAPFGSGWAAVANDLVTPPGVPPVSIHGPTYVNGDLDLQSDLSVVGGPLLQHSPPCSGRPQPSGHLGSTDAACTTAQVTGGTPALPCLSPCAAGTPYTFVARNAPPSYVVGPSADPCGVFLPGVYTVAPDLTAYDHYYFASGVYYFNNIGTLGIDGIDVIGGQAGVSEVARVSPSACADDAQGGVDDGSGVEWILGGNSAISVGSSSGTSFELFSRQPGSSVEGAGGISIRTVPAGSAGYVPTTAGTAAFANTGGGGSEVCVHGLVFAPNADVSVSATLSTGSELSGGVVASTLRLNQNRGPGPLGMVSLPPPAAAGAVTHQFFTIKSVASGGGTSKDVTTTAVIELSNDAGRSVVIDSWVTNAA